MHPGSAFFIVLRRMRAPLILLIAVYAVSILGLTLIPGVDAQGKPTAPLSFLHAFYFVSYTATTIGFGEIPQAFSEAQRMWVTAIIYATVIVWTYAILSILALFSDRAFQQALSAGRFKRRVEHLAEPFYIVCGCGETGGKVLTALDKMDARAVAIDLDENRLAELELEDFRSETPALAADAAQTQNLFAAGLQHRFCRGILALTNDDQANLAIAAHARLLRPQLPVILRVEHDAIAQRMLAFGATQTINPFATFARLLALAIHAPALYRLHDWLTGTPGTMLAATRDPPRGRWIVCGYGRFGHSLVAELKREGMEIALIDQYAREAHGFTMVVGSGVEPEVLRAAGVDRADGLIAATDDDLTNLSIALAARVLNPEIFIVLRQNQQSRAELFAALQPEMIMAPAEIIAHEALARLTKPLLPDFLRAAEAQGDDWAWALQSRLRIELGSAVPLCWQLSIDDNVATAIVSWIAEGRDVPLAALTHDPAERERRLACAALALRRDETDTLLPHDTTVLSVGDQILFVGTAAARAEQELIARNRNVLHYLVTGYEEGGWLWRVLTKKRPERL
ncbi:potassium channel family protein [Sulfuricystis multivorans]|uniref:potassium channel family protein n=1 Tax=Sulfuricystis multivorans TaxID=2211108 RepID=UPI000F81F9DE|nr:NAD-binding protein [Sulfuricystis multivorans]